MLLNKLNVLITRPEKEGRVLADKLYNMGISTHCQPMFDYKLTRDGAVSAHLLHNKLSNKAFYQLFSAVKKPIIIFVSVAAVHYANKIYNLNELSLDKVFAVGQATHLALKMLGVDAILPRTQTSEGLLSLPELQDVKQTQVVIIRGDGGREHLAQVLKKKKAIVYYFEVYQRIWRQLEPDITHHWQQINVNCIVITSDAILQSVVQLTNLSDEYWRTECFWVVPSERIARKANALGLLNVVNANGANDKAISDAIISDVINNMEQDDDR